MLDDPKPTPLWMAMGLAVVGGLIGGAAVWIGVWLFIGGAG